MLIQKMWLIFYGDLGKLSNIKMPVTRTALVKIIQQNENDILQIPKNEIYL